MMDGMNAYDRGRHVLQCVLFSVSMKVGCKNIMCVKAVDEIRKRNYAEMFVIW